jgi:hypothetical protein
MADYYELLKKAVSRVDPLAASESRQALYERARAAQLTQLLTIDPPLSEMEINDEQRALEEAVLRVEAEVSSGAPDEVGAPPLSDLARAANEIGRPIARDENGVRARAQAKPPTAAPALQILPPMMVRGDATGRLVRYWRWRPIPPKSAATGLASRR